ncbi:hypothetical protein CfE428DRAFT_2174 [Chthoniobacter flavus Ellin428]|uniref:DUF4304 domain-containing protein n=1 Tax=Chthoniobacter flavus Ellin428 TaxID=497964 RepID=B4CZT6_9BACT|nr:DUF4304 domain-containing protein [Chthoniobacter flavus]EDY20250.1 hypothetical protein CfE428DRAFT_2174 [Chthoniobacter flavus Ellin428]TCO94147.1 uncharacterized protein DUF4304 [Chthoniobacter flavus]
MDSKVVNKTIAKEIRPILESVGFSEFSARTSWRYHPERIDVINFQSFNSYLAGGIGCTSYSFSVNLGCYLLCIPDLFPIKEKNGNKRPEEYHCHFRGGLARRFLQKELERKDIWFIDDEARYLPQAISDVRGQIKEVALPWFTQFADLREVLRVLEFEEEDMKRLWGFGRNPSPVRSLMTGYVARALGDESRALVALRTASESGCFPRLQAGHESDKTG